MKTVIDVLKERGFIESVTHEEIGDALKTPLKLYCGFDPTSDSLHLGNLVAIMGLAWFQKFGHTPYVIVGGATGMIGDPSGKSSERQLLDEATIKKNLAGIRKDLEKVLRSEDHNTRPVFLNNIDWFKNFTLIDFLRDVGKMFRMGPMLAKDSVKSRLNSDEGMSFTEFSYQALQGYDFLYLFEKYDVTIQLGGSDQWGNIIAGTDLIRKATGKTAYGITFPLLTKSDGQKFGKSEKGAVWLSSEKLSPFEFYQYLVRVSDQDVIKLMKMITFMEMEEISKYQIQIEEGSAPNAAQKRLAEEVTRLVHGEEGLEIALKATSAIAPGSKTALDVETLENTAANLPSFQLPLNQVVGIPLIDLMVKLGMQTSKGNARELIKNGGAYINNEKVDSSSVNRTITESDLIEKKLLILGAGKKSKVLIRIESPDEKKSS